MPPFELDAEQIELLKLETIDYCLANGLVVRPQPTFVENVNTALTTHAPVALHPSPFPRQAFETAREIQQAYNELYMKIADDEQFMHEIMEELKEVDDFMKQLWELHLEVKRVGITQPWSLGLFRSDYLLHRIGTEAVVKQVEFNTISSSFGALAQRTSELHRHMSIRGLYGETSISGLPRNNAIMALASGIVAAHLQYGLKKAHVVFIVQEGERNAFDQRWIEYELLEYHFIISHRVPFTRVADYLTLSEDKVLHVTIGNVSHEVAVVYYRAGYGPEDYQSPKEWSSRKLIESSKAIKCPTIITQLAGSKKVQQVLSNVGVLERFIPQSAEAVRSTFVKLHTLDSSPAGQEAIKIALETPQNYVLKPQREGGGNNIYRDAIPDFLNSIPREKWTGYILMELIKPPPQINYILRQGEIHRHETISELGIYGIALWGDGKRSLNQAGGHLLRTKSIDTDEGGVAAGFACIDSPYLI